MTRRTMVYVLSGGASLAGCAALAQSSIAGRYKGKWQGATTGGEFEMSLERLEGEWKANVGFSIGDNAVPASVVYLKVGGEEMEVKYIFELGGVKLQSHLVGTFKDSAFTGKYKTQTVADPSPVDEGECSAKRV